MRLILLDSDKDYLESVRVIVSSQFHDYMEIITINCLEELYSIKQFVNLESYLLVHEDYVSQILDNEKYINLSQLCIVGILSEGIMNTALSTQLLDKLNPKNQGKNLEENILMKYQSIENLIESIKHNYLLNNQSKLKLGHTKTNLISIYKPYGDLKFPDELEVILKKFPSQFKILIIHYDPYYQSQKKTKFNLSYLFTMIKRGQMDLSLMIHETKLNLSSHVHMIQGPGNMLDIDYLAKEDYTCFLESLKSQLDYDYIIFNLNGIHLSQSIHWILDHSTECILCGEEEEIQLSVMRQTTNTWTMMLGDLSKVLTEVISKDA